MTEVAAMPVRGQVFVVTTDRQLTDEAAHHLRLALDDWKATGGPAVFADAGIHVAAQQPDGTWVRICHDHDLEPPLVPEGSVFS